ncbi:hypothetical protein [uncultured Treponema sp.]|uniref:hypothetical protein n=1 Tax=uncultured Treponema sp. TaxID=162155 RepID=UPI0025FFF724|nr:hypothetical protein [uncultured Treponema sp.]
MKKLFSRVISIFAVFALISCGLISCSDIENNESGSVSFSISPDLAKAVLDTGRSLRAETDPTGEPSANESPSPYRIEVSLSGGRAETKRHSYTESEWEAIADKSESVKGKENVTSFTFDNIPVGTQIAISATIFLASDGLDYPCMAGKSAVVEIQQGDNPVSFNVHRLAMFDIECSSDEEITGISKLNVYALDSDSKKASSLLEILKSADSSSESDAELFEKLEAEKSIYSYDKPKSPNLTGGFELKKGSTVNFFTLLYTENGVYLGHNRQSTTVDTSEIASLSFILKKLDLPDFTNLAFFPSDYADKTVSAWYASREVSADKTKIYALYLFGDNTFVATKRKIQDSGETCEIDKQGRYKFKGNADFENGEGVALVESKEYSFSIVDGLFSIAGVDTTYNLQTGSVPKAQSETESGDISVQFSIQFLFQTKEGVDDYAERSELPTATCDVDAVSEYEEIAAEATKKAIRLGYDFNEDKSDDEPVLINGVFVIRLYFDLKDYGSLFTATSTAAEGSSGDSSVYSQSGFKLTVYENLVYEITYTDGSTVTDARSVSKGIYDTTQSGVVITATEEEYFDFVAAEGDLSKLASGEYELTVVTDPKQQTLSISSGFFTFESAGGPLITFKIDSEQASSSISVKLDSIDETDLGGKIELSVTEDGKSVKITASPDESITVSQYKLILLEGQEQVSLPEGTLDSSTGSYVWTLTENIINNLSAGNHQITVIVTIAEKSYTVSANLTITK